MSYQVLARKWRPQDFTALVGQEPIVTALRNALREGRVAQAYLFSGIRGVGKTTAARVLAKALNCERGPAEDPCNECRACLEITAGTDLDVQEVDAATYSKVEQVRELTEGLRYGPARNRYKVVVIDEIHRLSRQAFDALLKIVEEPPPHLVFLFATTEIEAVPATILSRCQEYHFRRVPAQVLAAHLRRIATAEGIEASETALRLIARAGEGSVRDSVALLDQLATFGGSAIADDDAKRLLGGLDSALFHRLLAALLEGDPVAARLVVEEIEEHGWDPRGAFTQFLGYCRDALHLALKADPAIVDLPTEETVALRALADRAGYPTLLRLLHHLLSSEPLVRRSEAALLAVEVAWLRAAELPRLVGLETLIAGGGSPGGLTSQSDTTSRAGLSGPTRPTRQAKQPDRTTQTTQTAPEPPPPPADGSGLPALIERAGRLRPTLKAALERARLSLDGNTLSIEVTEAFAESTLQRLAAQLDRLVQEALGEGACWKLRRAPAPAEPAGESGRAGTAPAPGVEPRPAGSPPKSDERDSAAAQSRRAELSRHPAVQPVLQIFETEVESVEPRDQGPDGEEWTGEPQGDQE
ncbi:MAG TPA: DNA polymerase III subunit gamma/tau [Thermoanaerobaculia bacterium]|nr:DNA polymerase III subunit gamma/tau [Thermoanaerobaculia bacterium]